mmetsp:Transcript_67178/g.207745  ORF Transcript_67178/g.207745 Transcript_67178/m.207745 type:complete len:221 (+) Transcript_67178:557-1219(+)
MFAASAMPAARDSFTPGAATKAGQSCTFRSIDPCTVAGAGAGAAVVEDPVVAAVASPVVLWESVVGLAVVFPSGLAVAVGPAAPVVAGPVDPAGAEELAGPAVVEPTGLAVVFPLGPAVAVGPVAPVVVGEVDPAGAEELEGPPAEVEPAGPAVVLGVAGPVGAGVEGPVVNGAPVVAVCAVVVLADDTPVMRGSYSALLLNLGKRKVKVVLEPWLVTDG